MGRATTAASSSVAAKSAAAQASAATARASEEARSSGNPVVVDDLTTETNLVTAQPDGSLTLEANVDPVRTKVDGDWTPIDTTLQTSADGTLSPAATTVPVVFSAGGDSTLATAGTGADALTVSWDEGALPAASMSGDQVTYPNVRPGVDLVLTATASGYTDAFVVQDAEAAAALASDPPRLTVKSQGLDVEPQVDGSILATSDEAGKSLISPPPLAWDSSGGGFGEEQPDAASAGTGAIHAMSPGVVATTDTATSSSVTIEVSPPPAALTDPATVYPLYLDPAVDRPTYHWAVVDSGGGNYDEAAGNGTNHPDQMRVGKCGSGTCASRQNVARAYFSFDTPSLVYPGPAATVFRAYVQIRQTWGIDNNARQVALHRASVVVQGATWPGPQGTTPGSIVATHFGAQNTTQYLETVETAGISSDSVQQYLQSNANIKDGRAQFALTALDESATAQHKRFGINPSLYINYAYTPVITSPAISAQGLVRCAGEAVYAHNNVTLSASATAYDDTPSYLFQIFSDPTGNGPYTTPVQQFGWQALPSATFMPLTDGPYVWRAAALSSTLVAIAQPQDQKFIVDSAAPAAASIASADYPSKYWGRGSAHPGTFSVAAPSPDTAGVAYAFDDGSLSPPAIADTTCDYTSPGFSKVTGGVATITAPNGLAAGVHTLSVYTFDKAHNGSTIKTSYTFYVSPELAGTTPTNRVELETLTPNTTGGATASASGSSSVISATDSEASIDYPISIGARGYYALGLKIESCSNCPIEVSVPDAQVPSSSSTVADITTDNSGYVQLGQYSLSAGVHQLRVKFRSVPTTSKLDYLTVAQVQSGTYGSASATIASNLASAFNNNGIATTGPSGAGSLEGGTSAKALSPSELSAHTPGITAGQTFTPQIRVPDPTGIDPPTIAFPTFTIPNPNTNGDDNVIAAGQHIVMPANTLADHVDFLVGATCEAVLTDQHTRFDLVTQPTGSNPSITTNPGIPDGGIPTWLDGAAPDPDGPLNVIALDSYLDGTTPITSTNRLYVIEADVAPENRSDPLVEVGLPSTGTSLTGGCGEHAVLHVFAITTRRDSDVSPVSASSQWPVPGSSSVPTTTPIGATYSTALTAGTQALNVKDPAGASVGGTTAYDTATRRITFTSTAPLANLTAYTATLQGTDPSGNPVTTGNTWSFTTARPSTAPGICPCSIFDDSTMPTQLEDPTSVPVTLGVKFSSDVDGTVTGVRFYKSANNTSTHTGALWRADGTQLATGTFTDESTAGWQDLTFDTPVAISKNTTYTASYVTSVGHYSVTPNAFASSDLSKAPLRVTSSSGVNVNGNGFPTATSSSSYLVDVVFQKSAPSIAVTGQNPAPGATAVPRSSAIATTLSAAAAPGYTQTVTQGPANTAVPGTKSTGSGGTVLTFTPTSQLPADVDVKVTLTGVTSTDGAALPTQTWTFHTAAAAPDQTLFTNQVPATLAENDSAVVEVGTRFTPAVSGQVTAIRFLKGPGNGGTHVGSLWTSNGTKLASVTFTGETASGWQSATLATPVQLTAGTTYVVSYRAPQGHYAVTENFFTTPLVSGNLTAPSGAGRYLYGAAGGFPTSTYMSSNYFVDVVFRAS